MSKLTKKDLTTCMQLLESVTAELERKEKQPTYSLNCFHMRKQIAEVYTILYTAPK